MTVIQEIKNVEWLSQAKREYIENRETFLKMMLREMNYSASSYLKTQHQKTLKTN